MGVCWPPDGCCQTRDAAAFFPLRFWCGLSYIRTSGIRPCPPVPDVYHKGGPVSIKFESSSLRFIWKQKGTFLFEKMFSLEMSLNTIISITGFPLTCPDKIPWLSPTFWGGFSLTFPDLRIVVYIQMKQFEDNVSSSTSSKNILAYAENKERAWKQVELWLYLKMKIFRL